MENPHDRDGLPAFSQMHPAAADEDEISFAISLDFDLAFPAVAWTDGVEQRLALPTKRLVQGAWESAEEEAQIDDRVELELDDHGIR